MGMLGTAKRWWSSLGSSTTKSQKSGLTSAAPNMKGSYRGPQSGPGAHFDFEGNKDVGRGSIEIIDSQPPQKVTMKLDMIEPFEGHNIGEFTLAPRGDTTDVTWAMHGPAPFMAKLMGLFFNMDRMIGRDFEAGLANLKAAAERT